MTDITKKKRALALGLIAVELGGSYGDGVIILCAAINALAARVWPGKGKDQKRFVEVLKQFTPQKLNTTRISIPWLIHWLRMQRGRNAEKTILEKAFWNNPQVAGLCGESVDRSEAEVLQVCEGLLCRNEIRRFSYANLLYTDVRSQYSHEFAPSRKIGFPFSATNCPDVSYWNYCKDPSETNETEIEDDDTEWRIHFKANWIGNVALVVAQALDAEPATQEQSDPVRWWLDGG